MVAAYLYNYAIFVLAVCYKQCDRQSQVYDSKTFSFTVVKKEQEVKEPWALYTQTSCL